MKKLLTKIRSDIPHWVGDGFPVRSIFNYMEHGKILTPFLLMDYASLTQFKPTNHRRGVGDHPHRGFETVTIVYAGEVEHRDSHGGGGIIRPGDVQWMSAASGLVHQEFHSEEYAKKGGDFEMVQLWVNLPKKDKMNAPRYQGILNAQIPEVKLTENGSYARIIAGNIETTKGPANTYTQINLWDLRVKANDEISLTLPEGDSTNLFVLSGEIEGQEGEKITDGEIGIFQRQGDRLVFKANKDSKILLLGGTPIEEPIVGYGPFVMNTQSEIAQAFEDFNNGKMGVIEKIQGSDH